MVPRKRRTPSEGITWAVDPGKKSGLSIFIDGEVIGIFAIPCLSFTQLLDILQSRCLLNYLPNRLVLETQYKGRMSSWGSVVSVIRTRTVWECVSDYLGCKEVNNINPSTWKKYWKIGRGKNRKKMSKDLAKRICPPQFAPKLTNDAAESYLIGRFLIENPDTP